MFFRKGNEAPFGALNYGGVPDLTVEVLSPGTRRLDTQIKLPAFRDAGVPEVWFVDPQAREITIHALGEDGTRYYELCRGAVGATVFSRVVPGLRLEVQEVSLLRGRAPGSAVGAPGRAAQWAGSQR